MASNKKPSIYSDRGNIGTSEELDEYGVWVKSEPQVLSSESAQGAVSEESSAEDFSSDAFSAGDISNEDFSIEESADFQSDDFQSDDFQSEDLQSDDFQSSAFEDIDFSQDNTEAESGASDQSAELPSDESFGTDFDDFSVSDNESDAPDLEIPDPELDIPDTEFDITDSASDDLEMSASLGDDFTGEVPTVKAIENNIEQDNFESSSGRESDLSTQLLLKIANELSSIRSELSGLKKEFSVVRAQSPEDEKQEQEQERGGFFAEEDDETIALTGDELDNILNTADFTEESGAEENPETDLSSMEETVEESAETHVLDDEPVSSPELDDIDIDISSDFDIAEDDITEDVSETDIAASDLDETSLSEESDAFDLDETGISEESSLSEESDMISDDDFMDMDIDSGDLDISFDEETDVSDAMDTTEETEISDEVSDEISDEITEEVADETETADETAIDDFSGDDLSMDSLDDDSLDMDFGGIESDDADSEVSISDDFFADPVDADESVEEDFAEPDISETSKHSHEELEKLQQEGAKPITFAPDNSSYLEGEEAGFASDDSFDLSDAVIDEPVLSHESIDDEITEPSLDEIDDTELDMDSLDDLGIDETEEESPVSQDLETSFDDDFDQVIPEGFEAEIEETPVPFDDDLAGEIEVEGLDDTLDIPAESEEIEEETKFEAAPASFKASPATASAKTGAKAVGDLNIPSELKTELKNILSYMDQLLESLPEEKIEEFARSEYFDSYKKLFKELGLV